MRWNDAAVLQNYVVNCNLVHRTAEHDFDAERFELLACGHGPLVQDPDAKLASYIAHRLERERSVVAALKRGTRSVEGMLDEAWSDVPELLRPAAALTLAAHLDKLEDEGQLPDGVERPHVPTL